MKLRIKVKFHNIKKFALMHYKISSLIILTTFIVLILILSFLTRKNKLDNNIFLSNTIILLQIMSYITVITGLGTFLLNYDKVEDYLNNKRILRSKKNILCFFNHIDPLMKQTSKDYGNYCKKWVIDHHLHLSSLNDIQKQGMLSECGSETYDKDFTKIDRIGSWIGILDEKINKHFINEDVIKERIGRVIIRFFYNNRYMFLFNSEFYTYHKGCRNIYNRWKDLVQAAKDVDYFYC